MKYKFVKFLELSTKIVIGENLLNFISSDTNCLQFVGDDSLNY